MILPPKSPLALTHISSFSNSDVFTRALMTSLTDRLECKPLVSLSATENAHLVLLIKTTLEVRFSFETIMLSLTPWRNQIDEQRRSLDANGLRYLISIRSFYLINNKSQLQTQLSSSPGTSSPLPSTALGVRHRIRYRDIVWAFFSQSQEILLSASADACGGKMSWKDARALGVFLWLNSTESIVCGLCFHALQNESHSVCITCLVVENAS